jgi:uncharacterized membrane protein YjgN (DUF898 family)
MSQYPSAPQPAYQAPANHPQAVTVLILGILGLVLCQVLAPFGWVMGNRVVAEIDASAGAVGGRDLANIGRILGIIGTILLVIGVVAFIGFFVLGGILAASSST